MCIYATCVQTLDSLTIVLLSPVFPDVAKQELEKEWVRYARGLKKVFTSDEEVDSEEGEKGDEPKLIGDEDTVERSVLEH